MEAFLKSAFLRRGAVLALFLTLFGSSFALAQFTSGGAPQRVDVQINVFVDTMTQRAPVGLTVQLLDNMGGLELEGHTDGGGSVRFTTINGNHSIHIYGRGVEEATSSMEIEPVEMHKTENIIVRSKKEPGAENSPGGGATVPASRLNIPNKAQQEFEKGSNALGHKDWPEAKKHFEAAIAIFPDYDLAYNGLGDVDLATNDGPGARAAFEKAISLNKNFAEPYRNLARVAFAEHNYEEADNLLNQSLAIDPSNVRALTYAANAELLLHKYAEAIEHVKKAHALPHEGLAGAHIIAARAFEATQKPDDAVKEYRLYLSEEPQGRDVPMARDAIARLGASAK